MADIINIPLTHIRARTHALTHSLLTHSLIHGYLDMEEHQCVGILKKNGSAIRTQAGPSRNSFLSLDVLYQIFGNILLRISVLKFCKSSKAQKLESLLFAPCDFEWKLRLSLVQITQKVEMR